MRPAVILLVLVLVVALGLFVVRLRDRDNTDPGPTGTAATTEPAATTTPAATTEPVLAGGRDEPLSTVTVTDGPTDSDEPEAATTTTTSPITPSTTPLQVRPEIPLDQLLLDEIALRPLIPGFSLAPDSLLGTGPIDIETAAAAEADSEAELALLETRSFEVGFSRAFERDGDVVFLQVYRFGDADDAIAYLLDGADTVLARGAEPYDVGDLPGALGFTEGNPATGFVGHVVTFTVGRHHLLVIAGSSAAGLDSSDARAVAQEQHDHLVALTG